MPFSCDQFPHSNPSLLASCIPSPATHGAVPSADKRAQRIPHGGITLLTVNAIVRVLPPTHVRVVFFVIMTPPRDDEGA
jgi:hypothetical protein